MLNALNKNYEIYLFVSILIAGLVIFAVMVMADTVSTSVTVGNAAPTVTSLSLNGGSDITLVENSFKWVTTTMTVTDNNGCDTISSVSAKMYLASTSNSGTTCSANDNNCYPDTYYNACAATTTGNTCDGGVDTSAQYDCGFKLWFIAEGTDATGEWASSIWSVAATATDGTDTGTATNTTEAIEVNRLNSLDVTASIAYGTLSANSDSGNSNSTTTVTNTGNSDIDPELSGTDMTCSGNTLLVTQQEYSATPFTYGVGTDLSSTTPATLNITLPNPTATTTAVTDDVSWGIGIPAGQANCDPYTGTNTFTAVNGV